jgi:hypothetical protein
MNQQGFWSSGCPTMGHAPRPLNRQGRKRKALLNQQARLQLSTKNRQALFIRVDMRRPIGPKLVFYDETISRSALCQCAKSLPVHRDRRAPGYSQRQRQCKTLPIYRNNSDARCMIAGWRSKAQAVRPTWLHNRKYGRAIYYCRLAGPPRCRRPASNTRGARPRAALRRRGGPALRQRLQHVSHRPSLLRGPTCLRHAL